MLEQPQSTQPTSKQDPAELEPGLLAVFRLMMGIYLGFAAVGLVGGFLTEGRQPHQGTVWLLPGLVFLVVYLWWDDLRIRLGVTYLPIGLTIATLLPLIERTLLINQWLSEPTAMDFDRIIVASGWQLVFALFVPLILVAWQYGLREVILYCMATTAVELLFAAVLWHPPVSEAVSVIGMTMGRLFLYLVVGFVITRMVSAQREQRQKLSAANARLSHYAATAEQLAVSHERNRLARELHDTLAHTLSSLSVQLEAVDSVWSVAPEQAHDLLAKARANARSGLTETRRALQALRASPLDDLGLVLAVRNLAEATAARTGLFVQTDLCTEIDGLSPAVEQGIYRTAQEALANVAKHAGAQTVTVKLAQINGTVVLQIDDDGKGFDVSEQLGSEAGEDDEHYGLRGLYERANMIDGELTVVSQPGEGTSIRLEALIA